MHIVVSHTVVMGDDVHHNCDLMNDVTNVIKIPICTATCYNVNVSSTLHVAAILYISKNKSEILVVKY